MDELEEAKKLLGHCYNILSVFGTVEVDSMDSYRRSVILRGKVEEFLDRIKTLEETPKSE